MEKLLNALFGWVAVLYYSYSDYAAPAATVTSQRWKVETRQPNRLLILWFKYIYQSCN